MRAQLFCYANTVQTISKMKSQKGVTEMISKTANCRSGCSENYNFLEWKSQDLKVSSCDYQLPFAYA